MATTTDSPDDYGFLTDGELLAVYERSSGTANDTQTDALIAEIRRRALVV